MCDVCSGALCHEPGQVWLVAAAPASDDLWWIQSAKTRDYLKSRSGKENRVPSSAELRSLLPADIKPLANDFVRHMLTFNPYKRWSASRARGGLGPFCWSVSGLSATDLWPSAHRFEVWRKRVGRACSVLSQSVPFSSSRDQSFKVSVGLATTARPRLAAGAPVPGGLPPARVMHEGLARGCHCNYDPLQRCCNLACVVCICLGEGKSESEHEPLELCCSDYS